jgi:hypothetical protein
MAVRNKTTRALRLTQLCASQPLQSETYYNEIIARDGPVQRFNTVETFFPGLVRVSLVKPRIVHATCRRTADIPYTSRCRRRGSISENG